MNFNFYPRTGCMSFVCVLSCLVALTFSWPQISGRPVLVYLSSYLVQSLYFTYRHLAHGYLMLSSGGGCKSYIGERINNMWRKKELLQFYFINLSFEPSEVAPWQRAGPVFGRCWVQSRPLRLRFFSGFPKVTEVNAGL